MPAYGDLLGTDLVNIYVVSKRKHFHIHKQILCAKAPYFEKMFSGGFKEAKDQEAFLAEDDPEAFDLFIEWLYIGRLRPVDISKHTVKSGPLSNRVKLYYFADKICLPDLMDYTMSNISAAYLKFGRSPSESVAIYVYQNTSPTAKLRVFMAQAIYDVLRTSREKEWPLIDLGKALMTSLDLTMDVLKLVRDTGGASTRNPKLEPLCDYHIHEQKSQNCPYSKVADMGEI